MNKKIVVFFLAASIVACFHVAEAQQQKKVHRIGYLSASSRSSEAASNEGLRQGLHELGYIEGQNIVIEYRWGEGRSDQLPELAADLIRLNVDVMVVRGDMAILAAKQLTSTIPIVMAGVGDPVGRGFIASLARPGGNITGVSNLSVDISGKWLELLKETAPRIAQVAVLRNAANPTHSTLLKETQIAARALGVKLLDLECRSPEDFDNLFATTTKARVDALIMFPDPMLSANQRRVVDYVTRTRLSSMAMPSGYAEAGGLMAYGPNVQNNLRRTATYVDKILKGTKPADLPVELPTKFEFVINLKAAKQIGLTIPQSVLYRADKVIK
jgi:putative tryptophan/tyrosine transport system substrate-binding protein